MSTGMNYICLEILVRTRNCEFFDFYFPNNRKSLSFLSHYKQSSILGYKSLGKLFANLINLLVPR